MRLRCAKHSVVAGHEIQNEAGVCLVMVGYETENEAGVCKTDKSVKRPC